MVDYLQGNSFCAAKQGEERADGKEAFGAALWSWLNPSTWQMSNSSTLNVVQLHSNERGPGRRPDHRVPMNLHLSSSLNNAVQGRTTSLFYPKLNEKKDIWHSSVWSYSYSVKPHQATELIDTEEGQQHFCQWFIRTDFLIFHIARLKW